MEVIIRRSSFVVVLEAYLPPASLSSRLSLCAAAEKSNAKYSSSSFCASSKVHGLFAFFSSARLSFSTCLKAMREHFWCERRLTWIA